VFIFVCDTRSLYPRVNRNHSVKTSADCVTTSTVMGFNASNMSSLKSSCCNQRGHSVTGDKLLTETTTHRYALSCLLQLADTDVVSPSPARLQCTACHKSYWTVGGLSKHREFHCRELTAADPSSSRPPQHPGDFTGRTAVSTTGKDQRCPQCDKAYTSTSALKMHIRTHTLPCRCRLCGKAFSRPWLLQGHVRTHTGEKPFTCPHCQRAFADRSNLRAHLQTHYDVKQYHCDVCRRTFSRMSLLLKHRYGACAVVTDTGNSTAGVHAQQTMNS